MPVAARPYAIFGELELVAPERGGDAAQIALAVDHRQHLPLVRQQVERRTLSVAVRRRELGDDPRVRHDVGDARPFVDAPRAFHEQRLGRHGDARVVRQRVARALLEREEPFVPRHELEHHALDVMAELPLELALRDRAAVDEEIDHAARLAGLRLAPARALEILRRDAVGLQQRRLDRPRLAANRRLDDAAAVEEHEPFVTAHVRRDAQHARLPAQVEQLEDVVDA